MTKQSTDDIMMPGKFLALIMHMVTVTMAYFSYVHRQSKQHDNIVSAYPSVSLTTDELYIGARASFMACNTLTIIFLIFQFINLFVGVTMFRERHNLIGTSVKYLSVDSPFSRSHLLVGFYLPAVAVHIFMGNLGRIQVNNS